MDDPVFLEFLRRFPEIGIPCADLELRKRELLRELAEVEGRIHENSLLFSRFRNEQQQHE